MVDRQGSLVWMNLFLDGKEFADFDRVESSWQRDPLVWTISTNFANKCFWEDVYFEDGTLNLSTTNIVVED